MSGTPETDLLERSTLNSADWIDLARKLERERDAARKDLEFSRELYKVQEELLDVTRCQRDEAREDLEFRRGLDGARTAFVVEAMRERDEARGRLKRLEQLALAVVQRWDQPSWKDAEPTAAVIYKLRDALGVEE